ncbi:MAG: amidohydrolase family protein, partial [Deltaproteobacteria bacterium]|nr:amidohydrolase family protein [Deltaproteobacteria bacterium]
PVETLASPPSDLTVVAAGPMLTAPGGYPTRGWGRDGYGLPRTGVAALREAVDALHEQGARVIKVAMHGEPGLSRAELRAIAMRAHERGLKVVVHALGDAEARLAAEAGADVLAHTPLEPLQSSTVALWSTRAVISTLAAFGGSAVALDNLRRLREAGATVLYGTDLGNPGVRVRGISADEIELLGRAGLDGAAVVESATAAPAAVWGLSSLGAVAPGRAASMLVLDDDPRLDPSTLARPRAVYIDGVPR